MSPITDNLNSWYGKICWAHSVTFLPENQGKKWLFGRQFAQLILIFEQYVNIIDKTDIMLSWTEMTNYNDISTKNIFTLRYNK